MMKKLWKGMSVCLAMILLLASCAQQEPQQSTTAVDSTTIASEVFSESETEITTTETPVAEAAFLNVVTNGSTSFKVVHSGDAREEVSVAAILLRKAINDATGANVGIISDLSKRESDGSMEIIVGVTNRGISQEFKSSLGEYSFGIKVTEKGIVIAASHEDFVPLAVDYFLEHYLENSDLVQISDGNYAISSAASIICQGKLADMDNIHLDTNYATISELVAHVPKSGNFKAMQGGCVTEDYAYIAVINTTDYDTKDSGCYIYKYSTDNWKLVKRSGVLMLAHANDITYDPKTNRLYVAHCYVDSTKISIIDADTLKLVGSIHTDAGVYALDYHAESNTFVGGQGKSGTIFFKYNPQGTKLLTYGRISPTPTQMITQGICRDDQYVYHVMFSNSSIEPYNTIIIYDLEGKKLAHNVRLSISGQEPENISLVNGAFYIGCNSSSSTQLDIYKSVLYEFDFSACTPCP
jgi:hypothetical protein